MKIFKIFLLVAAPIILTSAVGSSTYTISKGYTVTINGTSNLHNWDEKVGVVSGSGVVNWNSDGSFDITAMTIKMNVLSIKSSHGSAMNKNTYKALKADLHPEIIFTLNAPLKSIQAKSKEVAISAKGSLSIAGVTKNMDMKVKISMQGDRHLIFEGSQTIKMTDYGIKPPTALLGTLKTGDEITINFKTSLQ